MEFGPRFIVDMNYIFKTRPGDVFEATRHMDMLSSNIQFKKGNIYSKSLVSDVDFNKDSWEIPLIMREYSEDTLVHNAVNAVSDMPECVLGYNIKKVVFPLYINGPTYNKSTFDTIMKCFFYYTRPRDRICTVKLKQTDNLWYGGRGIILDRDFNILFLITLSIQRSTVKIFKYSGVVCRLSPRLFPTKDIMSRGIVNKIVPFFTQEGILPSYNYRRDIPSFEGGNDSIDKITVMVDPDINRFLDSPKAPSAGISENDLHQCLIDNKMEILKMVHTP